MIRRLLPHEVSSITSLGKAMVEEIGGIPGGFNAGVFESNWRALLSSGQGIMIVSEEMGIFNGCVGGLITMDLNNGLPTFHEQFFFVKEGGAGLKLMVRLDKELKQIGIKIAYFASLESVPDKRDKIETMYKRFGYAPYNHTLRKTFDLE